MRLQAAVREVQEVLIVVDRTGTCFQEPDVLLHVTASLSGQWRGGAEDPGKLKLLTYGVQHEDARAVAAGMRSAGTSTSSDREGSPGDLGGLAAGGLANLAGGAPGGWAAFQSRLPRVLASAMASLSHFPAEDTTPAGGSLDAASNALVRGVILRSFGDLRGAEGLFHTVLAIRQARLGSDHVQVAHVLNSLANLLRARGKLEEAEPFYQRAFEIAERATGPSCASLIGPLYNWAEILRARGMFEEAEPLYRRCLRLDRHEGASAERAAVLCGLAELGKASGDYEAAEGALREALALVEADPSAAAPSPAAVLRSLASVLRLRGDNQGAAAACRACVQESGGGGSSERLAAAGSLRDLGDALAAAGDLRAAEDAFRRSMDALCGLCGPRDKRAALGKRRLARVLREKGDEREARELEEALREPCDPPPADESRKSQRGAQPSLSARLRAEEGRLAEAEELLRGALARMRERLGAAHPDAARAATELAQVLARRFKLTESKRLYRASLVALEQAPSIDSRAGVAEVATGLAAVLEELGLLREAEASLERALCLVEPEIGAEDPGLAPLLSGLVGIRLARGRSAGAEAPARRLVRLQEKGGAGAHGTAGSKWRLAEVLCEQGDLDAAASVYEEVVREHQAAGAAADLAETLRRTRGGPGLPGQMGRRGRLAQQGARSR
uniref:Tpr repeat-containing protein n=1 Tax=Tetraselmis sp. GSL018 TaxID=582737 RepID=A0A061QJZ4_9CHLO